MAAIDSSFSIPDMGVDGEWFVWARDYIYDSKRLLTLRRNHYVFNHAVSIGYERVRRKEGIEIDLTAIDVESATTVNGWEEVNHFLDLRRSCVVAAPDETLTRDGEQWESR